MLKSSVEGLLVDGENVLFREKWRPYRGQYVRMRLDGKELVCWSRDNENGMLEQPLQTQMVSLYASVDSLLGGEGSGCSEVAVTTVDIVCKAG